MATVHIPAHWRDLTGGRATIEVPGGTLQRVLDGIVREAPALGAVLLDGATVPWALQPIFGTRGFLNPIVAAAAMAISSVSVMTNSLRLRHARID